MENEYIDIERIFVIKGMIGRYRDELSDIEQEVTVRIAYILNIKPETVKSIAIKKNKGTIVLFTHGIGNSGGHAYAYPRKWLERYTIPQNIRLVRLLGGIDKFILDYSKYH